MTYADRAAKFLERTASDASSVATGYEINEINEKRGAGGTVGRERQDEINEKNEKSHPSFQPKHWARDPRPDLIVDSAVWDQLLARAYDRDGDQVNGLFGSLHGLRCWGAGFERRQGRLRLVGGDLPADEYALLRARYLVPHQAALVDLIALLEAEAALTTQEVAGPCERHAAGGACEVKG